MVKNSPQFVYHSHTLSPIYLRLCSYYLYHSFQHIKYHHSHPSVTLFSDPTAHKNLKTLVSQLLPMFIYGTLTALEEKPDLR